MRSKIYLMHWFLTAAIYVAALLVGTAGHAASKLPGSRCGLIDFADDLSDYTVAMVDLGELSPKELARISPVTASQIILTARDYSQFAEDSVQLDSVEEAVKYLLKVGYDAHLVTVRINAKPYRIVKHFPGDNPCGLIFKLGETQAVAEIQDSDVICKPLREQN